MSKEKKFAVILSGSGVFDGSEIHEATMTLYAIALQGATYQAFAPNIEQYHVINHLTGEVMSESRNVLVEAARIARGAIIPLNEYNPNEFDALIIPGGYGVAKNLSNFAFKGAGCAVNPEVETAIRNTHKLKKPIGALCIAPVVLAKLFGNVTITIGQDKGTTEAIESMGAKHQVTGHGEVAIDRDNLLFTTPCYMIDSTIVDIANGANAIVREMLKFI